MVSWPEQRLCSMLLKSDFSVENVIFVGSLEIVLQK